MFFQALPDSSKMAAWSSEAIIATTATMRTTANEKGTTGAFAIYNISRVVLEIVHGFCLKSAVDFLVKFTELIN